MGVLCYYLTRENLIAIAATLVSAISFLFLRPLHLISVGPEIILYELAGGIAVLWFWEKWVSWVMRNIEPFWFSFVTLLFPMMASALWFLMLI